MYKYRHIKTGRIVVTTCPVNSKQWDELTEDQDLSVDGKDELTEDQAPAKPAKKGKK